MRNRQAAVTDHVHVCGPQSKLKQTNDRSKALEAQTNAKARAKAKAV